MHIKPLHIYEIILMGTDQCHGQIPNGIRSLVLPYFFVEYDPVHIQVTIHNIYLTTIHQSRSQTIIIPLNILHQDKHRSTCITSYQIPAIVSPEFNSRPKTGHYWPWTHHLWRYFLSSISSFTSVDDKSGSSDQISTMT